MVSLRPSIWSAGWRRTFGRGLSSARDADFTGKLVDVHPDGRAMILTEGILRALPHLAHGP